MPLCRAFVSGVLDLIDEAGLLRLRSGRDTRGRKPAGLKVTRGKAAGMGKNHRSFHTNFRFFSRGHLLLRRDLRAALERAAVPGRRKG